MRKKDLARKITSWITLGVFSMQPILTFAAEILPDTSTPISQQPLVMETASGHPLVQIAPPSAGGVSMNLYTFFNVPERGAILNNSYNLSNTELAGYVQGNPNLMGGTARIIVNEVTSANPSELRGFLEVAGDRAGVVIANPNGILADGAGFLNTARVTLATGRTAMDAAGNLAALRIDDGKVVITGNGLSAKGVDSAELYARAIEVNAGLWAEHAKIVTGANTIRYADGEISPITADSNTPAYALDLSAIGGMYANRIALIGTEKGLGVNLKGQITSTQATSLDVNGNLKTSGNLYSDGTTSIHAKDIENSGTIYSVADTNVSATALQNDGKIISDANTALQADTIINRGTLGSSIAPSGAANANGVLTIDAKTLVNSDANILSGNDISITADNIHTQNGTIAGNGDISVVAAQHLDIEILKQTGKRYLEGYSDDETAFKALMDAGITYAKEMNLSPGISLSKEQVAALTSDMVWLEERDVYVNGKKERAVYPVLYTKNTNGLRLTAGGSLISAKNIVIGTKDALKNAGTLYGENILAQAGDIENTGLIRGQKIGLKSERDIRVQGSVIGDKAVVLEAKNNIDVSSTTERLAHQDVLNTTAGIAVKGDKGVLVVSAGKNAALAGATLAALGKNGSILTVRQLRDNLFNPTAIHSILSDDIVFFMGKGLFAKAAYGVVPSE